MSIEIANRLRCYCPQCVDFHAHFLQREVFDLCQPHSVSSGFGKNIWSPDHPALTRMLHPEMQIREMDERGMDVSVLSSADALQSRAWATPDEERRMTAAVNEECLRWVEAYPGRFIGSAVLPLGDMRMALADLVWAKSAGLKVVQLPTNYRGAYLGHSRFIDLLAAIRDNGMVIFVHPEGVTDPWFQDYAMWNSIGQSIEEVRVMSSLIYEGLMDRLPGINIVMSHGGGYMPHYMGRLDRNQVDKPFTARNLTKKPSEYLSDFYYDTCVYDPRTLELLVERVGIDRVLMGADYPASLLNPFVFLAQTNLTDQKLGQIAGNNALRLLKGG